MQLRSRSTPRPRSSADDEVHRWELVLVQSERLPDDPANSIALNRAARGAHGDREPYTRPAMSQAAVARAVLARPGRALAGMARAAMVGTAIGRIILSATVHSQREESIAKALAPRMGRIEFRLATDPPFRR